MLSPLQLQLHLTVRARLYCYIENPFLFISNVQLLHIEIFTPLKITLYSYKKTNLKLLIFMNGLPKDVLIP